MPIYEYRCCACDNTFSTLVASSDMPDEEITCPRCKEHRAEKLLSMKSAIIDRSRTAGSAPVCRRMPEGGGCACA